MTEPDEVKAIRLYWGGEHTEPAVEAGGGNWRFVSVDGLAYVVQPPLGGETTWVCGCLVDGARMHIGLDGMWEGQRIFDPA